MGVELTEIRYCHCKITAKNMKNRLDNNTRLQIEAVNIIENNSYLYDDNNANNSRRGTRLRKKPDRFDQSVMDAPHAASTQVNKIIPFKQRNLRNKKEIIPVVKKSSPRVCRKSMLKAKNALTSTPLPGVKPKDRLPRSAKKMTVVKKPNENSKVKKRDKVQGQKLSPQEKNPTKIRNKFTQSTSQSSSSQSVVAKNKSQKIKNLSQANNKKGGDKYSLKK